jgi:aspartate/methionine/tyrosine aminotransferase
LLIPFRLEDFFDKYEHRSGVINLASSDAQPWAVADLRKCGISLADDEFTIGYPNVNSALIPGLKRLCNPPNGFGLLPTSGAAEAIALVMHECAAASALGAEKRVVLPRPSFGAFHGLAELLHLQVERYSYDPTQNWTPNHAELLTLSRRCGALIVINPHNPTGRVMPPDLLRTLAQELAAHGGTLIVDEVFRVADEGESALGLMPNVIVIGSLSKTYGLPGLRLGWVGGTKDRLPRLRTIQQYLTLTLNTFTVKVGAAILRDAQRFSRGDLVRANRRVLSEWADSHKDIILISPPEGGTTVCLAIATAVEEERLFERFLDQGVLLAPGVRCFEFSSDGRWFRLGYGLETQKLRIGLDRLSAVFRDL